MERARNCCSGRKSVPPIWRAAGGRSPAIRPICPNFAGDFAVKSAENGQRSRPGGMPAIFPWRTTREDPHEISEAYRLGNRRVACAVHDSVGGGHHDRGGGADDRRRIRIRPPDEERRRTSGKG